MRRFLTVLTVLCLLLAACGKSDKKKDESGSSKKGTSATAKQAGLKGKVNDHGTKTVADGATVEVELDDDYFGPTFIKAKAGAHITLEIKNEGKLKHTFTMDKPKVDEELAPDASKKVSITVPSGAAAPFHCRFHQDAGMQGALVTS